MNESITICAKALFTSKNHTAGLSQELHTALVRNVIVETIFTEFGQDSVDEAKKAHEADPKNDELKAAYDQIMKVRGDLYTLLYPMMNGSALRQKFETAGLLAKSESGKKGANATALATKYA